MTIPVPIPLASQPSPGAASHLTVAREFRPQRGQAAATLKAARHFWDRQDKRLRVLGPARQAGQGSTAAQLTGLTIADRPSAAIMRAPFSGWQR